MNTIFSFILVLGLLIFVHELGHFLVAKLCGVRVLKFSLGFGPKIFGKVVGETEYVLSALPLGGYVKMFGENPDEQNVSPEDRAVSFSHKTVLQRFAIVFAGPAFNFLFPLLLFFVLFFAVGVPKGVDSTRIDEVLPDSPAAAAGMVAGDEIQGIDGQPVSKWADILEKVHGSEGKALMLTVQRGDQELTLRVIPKITITENNEQRYLIGIRGHYDVEYMSLGPLTALQEAASQTWTMVIRTAEGFAQIVQRAVPASELGGPILIAQIAGEQMRAGWMNLLYFMGFLSINLGILNLLPVPVLDGGHLFFLVVEALRRKPLEVRVQIIAQQVGIVLLGSLMIFVFYNDIMRIIG